MCLHLDHICSNICRRKGGREGEENGEWREVGGREGGGGSTCKGSIRKKESVIQ